MYTPIIKNKLNELKAIETLDEKVEIDPIFELFETKKESTLEDFKWLNKKTNTFFKKRHAYIDLPTYTFNDFIDSHKLTDPKSKVNFFKELKQYFDDEKFTLFTPVISFDYSYSTEQETDKNNLKYVNLLLKAFNKIAIRVFAYPLNRKDDFRLLNTIFALLDEDELENITLIIDTDQIPESEILDAAEIAINENANKIILAGEAFNYSNKFRTSYQCGRIKNKHLSYYKDLVEKIDYQKVAYADFTLLEKVQPTLDIDPDKGFAYYPFIKYTTEDGNLCMFTADERGKYYQYKDLCDRVIYNIDNYNKSHCDACTFIYEVTIGEKSRYKAGATWKHRMIAHHITVMSTLV
ncbi:MAG: beta family protein [Campylobacterota bacterium]